MNLFIFLQWWFRLLMCFFPFLGKYFLELVKGRAIYNRTNLILLVIKTKNMYALLQFFQEFGTPKIFSLMSRKIHDIERGSKEDLEGVDEVHYNWENEVKLDKKEIKFRKKLVDYFENLFHAANYGYFVHNFEGKERFSSCNYFFTVYEPEFHKEKYYMMLTLILPYNENPNMFKDDLISACNKIKKLKNLGNILYRQEYSVLDGIIEDLILSINRNRLTKFIV